MVREASNINYTADYSTVVFNFDVCLTRAINKSSCPLHVVVFIHDALFLRMRTSSF